LAATISPSQVDTDETPRVLLIILDGFGFNLRTEERILARVQSRLSQSQKQILAHLVTENWRRHANGSPPPSTDDLVRLALSPVLPTSMLAGTYAGIDSNALSALYHSVRTDMAAIPGESDTDETGLSLLARCNALVEEEALAARYAIWYARSPYLNSLRNDYPTVATEAAGLAAGYEDVDPPVQGNSETGHQQIGNFIVAAQTPLEISSEIADGRFFENSALLDCLREVKDRKSHLDVCFLLSGERGNDGRVHSAWNHLEALLEAAFNRAGLLPSQVRLEAITDGRDCPPYSSVEQKGDQYGFLYKLQALLRRYNAEESLAWIIGRGIAMDRDYEEARTETDFRMLVNGDGTRVQNLDSAIDAVRAFHESGGTDTSVPPTLVGPEFHTIEPGDVFLDLNFRADRQRSKVAALLGARDFIEREAAKKGQTWRFDWLNPPANLSVYCLSEYHPDFAAKYGARVLYPIGPQPHNLFALLPEQSASQGFPFRYLLTAESTKALHVGYFIRGRRESPVVPEEESRTIVPSYGQDYGVLTDDDYYKAPQMRLFALVDVVVEALTTRQYNLIAVNFANTDMVGHLMPKRWNEAQCSVELVDTALETVVPVALRAGFDVIITADHGNVEDDDSSHTANDILTTFVSPDRSLELRGDPRDRARLFDIPWSILEILGLTSAIIPHLPPIPEGIKQQGLVGRSLIRVGHGDHTLKSTLMTSPS
jgi:2,3-bisphosphoglycerate-independent phosphoglycerate mutase